jgi:LacI family transcriptional regulator
MGSTPTVYDVAAHAGVSIATVSRVLRRPDDVREATRQRVLASIRELGYVPSASARGLASRRTGVIGIFMPGFDDARDGGEVGRPATQRALVQVIDDRGDQPIPQTEELYFDGVLRGAELEAWRHAQVLVVGVGRNGEPEDVIRDLAGRVDGLVILARSLPADLIDYVSRRIPIVLLASSGRGTELDRFDHVAAANTEGMQMLIEHLITACGVRDIAYLVGSSDSPDGIERLRGLRQAIEHCEPEVAVRELHQGEFRREDGEQAARQLIAADRLPRALVCANDQMALGALEVFNAAGVDVPGRVIVTGFDGIGDTRRSTPRLTTVRQPMAALGQAAVELMVQRIADPDRAPVERRLPVQVLIRESSG